MTARARANFGLKPGFGLLQLVELCLKSRGAEAVGDRLDQAVELAAGLLKLAALEVDREFGRVWRPVADDVKAGWNADTGWKVSTGLQRATAWTALGPP